MYLNLKVSNLQNYVNQYKIINKKLNLKISDLKLKKRRLNYAENIADSELKELEKDLDKSYLDLQAYKKTLKFSLYPMYDTEICEL